MPRPRARHQRSRDLRDLRVFEWVEADGLIYQFTFENTWRAIRFKWGHIARDYEWGQA